MGAISLANVKFAGLHVGFSIGEDGSSQMALEDSKVNETFLVNPSSSNEIEEKVMTKK